MEASSSEYEFLDLTDINEEERSSLNSALFAPPPATQLPTATADWSPGDKTEPQVTWTDPNYVINDAVNMTPIYVIHPHAVDLSSCSSGTPGPPTTSSSLDSLTATAVGTDMAPHSPQRSVPTHTTAQQPVPPPPQLAYTQPPPHVYNTTPNHWPQHLIPPNVYVSQVTANVNVHGYMGQYYQPQYIPHAPPSEPRGRDGRDRAKGRRGGMKRTQSPTNAPYMYYQQYYPSPQSAQGAPLYHVPVYPVGYVASGYPYMPYVDYSMMEDPNNPVEKGPEEYAPDMMLEQEHVSHEMFYPTHPACLPPAPMYDPTRTMEAPCPIDPYPQYYQIPPPIVPPVHQFNVNAKNFVRQNEHKSYNQPLQENKSIESKTNEVLSIKDLKISSGKPNPPKQGIEKIPKNEKPMIKQSPEAPTVKTTWTSNKTDAGKPSTTTTAVVQKITTITTLPVVNKTSTTSSINKVSSSIVQSSRTTPTISQSKTTSPAPFINKTFVKTGPTQQLGAVILPQQGLPAKAPFANKHKKETPTKAQEAEQTEPAIPVSPVQSSEVKQNIPIKPAASPTVSVPIHNQNSATITTKAPFVQSKKATTAAPDVPIVAPPPAPTSSDFPPPPATRRSIEPPPNSPIVQALPSGRSWASLFDNSSSAPPHVEESNLVQPTVVVSNVTATVASNSSNQRPIAKVGPYDASPLLDTPGEKGVEKSLTPVQKKDNNKAGQCSAVPAHINDPNAYRLGEYLLNYKLDHQAASIQPRGLCNRSNYCYINAILQALIACPPFFNMLRNIPYQLKKGKSSTPIIDAMVELVSEYSLCPPIPKQNRQERVQNSNIPPKDEVETYPPFVPVGTPFEPTSVLHMLRDMNNGDSFRVEGRQEDAEEFLGCLLNGINDEMLEMIKLVEPGEATMPIVNGNSSIPENEDNDEWKVMGPKNKGSIERPCLAGRTTPLSDIFRGLMRSRLQRASDTTSDTTLCSQPFFTLPLDIEKCNSVREALDRVAGKDRLEGVTCPSRGRPVEAWQQVQLDELPAVLLLHLKCFHSRPSDGATVKIIKSIDVPIDLKMDQKVLTSKMKYNVKQKQYKLFAIVYHEGSEAEKGHYLTDVYHVGCGGWLRYDDTTVVSVPEYYVLHPRLPRTPYLLFYRRQDTIVPKVDDKKKEKREEKKTTA